jgi:tRNA (Thr-GGU) A37 N-methylase
VLSQLGHETLYVGVDVGKAQHVAGIEEHALTVRNLEAIDGTPVLDVKPVLGTARER